MEAPALALRGPRAIARAEPAVLGRRIGGLYLLTGLALFALMGVLGLVMRLSQADVYTLPPTWFYRIMTLHGAGMLVGALLAQMGAMWYALRDVVPLHLGRALAAWLAILAGTVLVLVSVLVGGFATGWTFLWPLPFTSAGAWRTWATAMFLVGLVVVGAGFQVYCIDILARTTARYGGLGRALGIAYLRGRDDDPPPPQVIGATVVALDGLVASAAGVTVLVALLGKLTDGRIEIDALWAKNVTYFFGHSYANLIIYLAVGAVYVVLPRFVGRPWTTTKPIVIGWLATLTFVITAYSHHLYMDFAQPVALQAISTASSSGAALPVLVVTIYTGMLLVWGSRYRWTLASTLVYLGFAGWAIGGAGAVIDSLIPANFRLHNTLWVPAHFHTYLLLAVMFWAMALVVHLLEEAAGSPPSRSLRILAPLLMVVGGYGLVGAWYVSGALGVPRRYAVQPVGTAGYSLAGSIFALVFALGFLLLLAALVQLARLALRRPRAAAPAGEEASAPPAESAFRVERPVVGLPMLATLAAVGTVSFAAVLPPVSRAAEAGVQWHHIGHSAMFLAGAAFGLALASTSDVWERLTVRLEQSGLVLAIVMPALALLAMSPRLYEGVEDDPALHFAYHLIFLVLGALASLGSAALGRVPAWSLIGLASGMGVLYAAGVVGG
jgi:cytochrome c oxidase subunit I